MNFNPETDLRIEVQTSVPASYIWQGLTDESLLLKWFCPKPWHLTSCEIEAKAGGKFAFKMKGPDSDEEMGGEGCVLEVVPMKRLVWTSGMAAGYHPVPAVPFSFTAVIELEENAEGTLYRVSALHADAESRDRHKEMGFETGWKAAFLQLVDLYR